MIVFFNIGWMEFYNGLSFQSKVAEDSIVSSSKYILDRGWGHEIFNFREEENKYYGYVQASSINLEKLGGSKDDNKIKNVTVVWTAPHPSGGTRIIGWYKNATVYRTLQELPLQEDRFHDGVFLNEYYVSCNKEDAKLLFIDERVISVLRGKKDWMGQSCVWYAENNPEFVKRVLTYIDTGKDPSIRRNSNKSKSQPRSNDPKKKAIVESKAIEQITSFYENCNYTVSSVEKENLGWDLEAINGGIKLKLEVKGLSGKECRVQLTPNEYKAMNQKEEDYRLCIVSCCLEPEPTVQIFRYSNERDRWIDQDNKELIINEMTSAQAYI